MNSSFFARCASRRVAALTVILLTLLPFSARADEQAGETVSVMTFNLWDGGTHWQPLETSAEAIRRAGADVVGLQEVTSDGCRRDLAEMLGMHSTRRSNWGRGTVILSRWPIVEEIHVSKMRGVIAVIDPPGDAKPFAAMSVHLPASHYGPYKVRDGKDSPERLRRADYRSARLKCTERALEQLREHVPTDMPTFVVGDFNTPSHLDWVEETKDQHFGQVVEWAVTKLMETAGFADAWRVDRPDPVKDPGITWPAQTEEALDSYSKRDLIPDRIDFIFFRGEGIKVLDTKLVGASEASDVQMEDWPSDHRSVVATFQLPDHPQPRPMVAETDQSPVAE